MIALTRADLARLPDDPPAHPCPGCAETVEGTAPLCDDCGPRHARLGEREYPELAADDAAWLDRVDEILTARRAA